LAFAFAPALESRASDHRGLLPGLVSVTFNEADLSRPERTGFDSQINIDTGKTFNTYSQFWSGYLRIPTSRPITLEAEADNGLRLTFNGKPAIDGWTRAAHARRRSQRWRVAHARSH
jgi:hypothetical protein